MYYGANTMIVYIYTFPNGKKYVGQTARPLNERAKRGEGYVNSPMVYNAICKYGWDNIKIETFNCHSKQEMNELEQYYIKLYNTTNNKYGYNLTLGGEGNIQIDREAIINYWQQGLSIGEITKLMNCSGPSVSSILKIQGLYDKEEIDKRARLRLKLTSGEKLKEYYMSPEHQQERIQNGLKGAKVRSKPVVVYKDKDCTQLVGIYESGRKCAKVLGIDHSSPSYALRHNHYSNGYYFYFLEDKINDMPQDCTWEKIFG